MNIVMVITRGDDLGGAQMHVATLALGLVREGHSVRIIAGIEGAWTTTMQEAGIPVERCDGMLREISPVRDIAATRLLAQRLRQLAPDLVCAHSSKAGMLTRLAARLASLPCVFTAHGWSFTDGIPQPRKAVYRMLELTTSPLASRIICVSEYDRGIALRAGMLPRRLALIPNGVPDVAPDLLATPRERDPFRVVMVARFAEPKDQELVIQAVRGLPHVQVDFVGDGPRLASAVQMVSTLGLTERVHFLGVRRDVPQILAAASAFVLASKFEGFPMSTIEAMRAGLPVLVSDVGGASEAIVDGESGFLFPKGDAVTLRERLLLLSDKPDRRELMGNAARRRYEAHFSADVMVRRTLELYEDVLRTRSSRRRMERGTHAPGTMIHPSPERMR